MLTGLICSSIDLSIRVAIAEHLSPLGRGFAVLQNGDHIISLNEPLSKFAQIAIALKQL
ncbi:MAG: hypothetical protein SFT94_07890 [Pseudanabaenaceae cyanobacterium bins.68]|nr:hypothetical protein [Pseudanabaenaceae cyanobacterium bins.68]